jgi:hypothetical protein
MERNARSLAGILAVMGALSPYSSFAWVASNFEVHVAEDANARSLLSDPNCDLAVKLNLSRLRDDESRYDHDFVEIRYTGKRCKDNGELFGRYDTYIPVSIVARAGVREQYSRKKGNLTESVEQMGDHLVIYQTTSSGKTKLFHFRPTGQLLK